MSFADWIQIGVSVLLAFIGIGFSIYSITRNKAESKLIKSYNDSFDKKIDGLDKTLTKVYISHLEGKNIKKQPDTLNDPQKDDAYSIICKLNDRQKRFLSAIDLFPKQYGFLKRAVFDGDVEQFEVNDIDLNRTQFIKGDKKIKSIITTLKTTDLIGEGYDEKLPNCNHFFVLKKTGEEVLSILRENKGDPLINLINDINEDASKYNDNVYRILEDLHNLKSESYYLQDCTAGNHKFYRCDKVIADPKNLKSLIENENITELDKDERFEYLGERLSRELKQARQNSLLSDGKEITRSLYFVSNSVCGSQYLWVKNNQDKVREILNKQPSQV